MFACVHLPIFDFRKIEREKERERVRGRGTGRVEIEEGREVDEDYLRMQKQL